MRELDWLKTKSLAIVIALVCLVYFTPVNLMQTAFFSVVAVVVTGVTATVLGRATAPTGNVSPPDDVTIPGQMLHWALCFMLAWCMHAVVLFSYLVATLLLKHVGYIAAGRAGDVSLYNYPREFGEQWMPSIQFAPAVVQLVWCLAVVAEVVFSLTYAILHCLRLLPFTLAGLSGTSSTSAKRTVVSAVLVWYVHSRLCFTGPCPDAPCGSLRLSANVNACSGVQHSGFGRCGCQSSGVLL